MNAVYDALPFIAERRLRSVALPNALNLGFDYSLFLKVGVPAGASTTPSSSRWAGCCCCSARNASRCDDSIKACKPVGVLRAFILVGVAKACELLLGLSQLLCPSLHLSCTTPASCCIELPSSLCTWLPALAVHGKPGRAMILSPQVEPCRHSCGTHRSRATPPMLCRG